MAVRHNAVTGPQNEFKLIEAIREKAKSYPGLLLGIGDDTAILGSDENQNSLITADMLLEGVHFTHPGTPAYSIGRKALAVNISDIAAMAGTPTAAVISIAIPKSRDDQFIKELYQGMFDLADEYQMSLAGGDTNSWDGPFVINITVIGTEHEKGSVLRSGAKPGDWIMCTGAFGNSLKSRHLTFSPRVHEAQILREKYQLHAMIDVSDGLSADLYHILEESKVGAILDAPAIPIHLDVEESKSNRTPLEQALGDGEDFELLFTLPEEDGRALLESPPFETRLTKIGEITQSPNAQLRLSDDEIQPLPHLGWEHLT